MRLRSVDGPEADIQIPSHAVPKVARKDDYNVENSGQSIMLMLTRSRCL